MEDLEGQEAAPTTENEISLVEVLVEVTQEDIDKGCIAGKPGLCPVHLALRRVVRREWGLHVLQSSVEFAPPDRCLHLVAFPDLVYRWIKAFDRGEKSLPFTFSIRVPANVVIPSEGQSSSNETTEPPAKEKYSAFTINPSALEGLYDACEKALDWFDRYGKAPVIASQLAAALTKAGKK